MLNFSIIIIFTITFLIKSYDCRNYTDYYLYRGVPANMNHLAFFRNLSDIYKVNFWRSPGQLHKPIDFIISPEDRASFLEAANQEGIYLTTVMKDIQRAFDKQTVTTYIRRNMQSFNWQSFFRLKDIYNWLKDLQAVYSNEITLHEIGKSAQGRPILAVKIILSGCKNRSTVFVEGGIHAREWISPAFVTYMIHKTITVPRSMGEDWRLIAMTYNWVFVPVINPDGYEYSHKEDRLWRKNRNEPSVDLNRNFDLAFATVGVSQNPKSDIFCGHYPFSEPETTAMAKFIKENSDNLEYYISFHSYGQYIIIPYAHMTSHEENYENVKVLGKEVAKTIYKRYRVKYHVGTAYDTVGYQTSGVSGCWVKKNFKVPYVMTFELRDDGTSGFALPVHQILPTCQETMDGIKTLLKPQTHHFQKLRMYHTAKQNAVAPDVTVSICNILLFLIVRFY